MIGLNTSEEWSKSRKISHKRRSRRRAILPETVRVEWRLEMRFLRLSQSSYFVQFVIFSVKNYMKRAYHTRRRSSWPLHSGRWSEARPSFDREERHIGNGLKFGSFDRAFDQDSESMVYFVNYVSRNSLLCLSFFLLVSLSFSSEENNKKNKKMQTTSTQHQKSRCA